jgi:diadenosine tetraphosphate (Ap4A) HIT family hydrolase
LIVSPIVPALSLSQVHESALELLGPTLATVTEAIETVVRPERVYCALFSEETRSVHFHLFPRSVWLLSQYAGEHPTEREISGPRLLDWARRTFHAPMEDDYVEVVEAIFHKLAQKAN